MMPFFLDFFFFFGYNNMGEVGFEPKFSSMEELNNATKPQGSSHILCHL